MAPLVPTLVAHARGFLTSAISLSQRNPPPTTPADDVVASLLPTSTAISKLGPLAARTATALLAARDDGDSGGYKNDPHKGSTNFRDVNNTGVFVVFGLIGCSFVGAGIWFFFWARNGGFYFKEDDWDDYKSTVLRRKGPNGTVLSGATKSTRLGGGSAYKDYDAANTEYTGGLTQVSGDTGDTQSTMTGVTGITGGVSDFVGRARRKAKRDRKEREKEKKKKEMKEKHHHHNSNNKNRGEDGALVDEEAEAEAQSHLRAYRHEKAARVGGINKESEGSQWDGSTNPSHSTVSGERSDLLSHREGTPTKDTPPPKKKKKNMVGARKMKKSRKEKEGEGSSYYQPSSAAYRDDATTDVETEAERETVVTGVTGTTGSSGVTASTNNDTPTKNTNNTNNTRKAGGIRKVYSTAQRNEDREQERIRAEARRLAEKGRAAGGGSSGGAASGSGSGSGSGGVGGVGIGVGRRFSYQRAESYQRGNRQSAAANPTTSVIDEESDIGLMGGGGGGAGGGRYLPAPESAVPEEEDADADERGTKSYHCVIPGLSSVGAPSEVAPSSSASNFYQEEKRKKRGAAAAGRR